MNAEHAARFVQTAARLAATGDREGAVRSIHGAIRYCEEELRAAPDDLETVDFLASCYMKLGLLPEAAKYYRRAISLNPNVAQFHQSLGLALLHQSMLDEAEAPFRSAIALNPSEASHSYSGLAQIVLGRGDEEEAALLFRRAYECEPAPAIGKFYLGRAYIHEGNLEQAESAFREAIALRPAFADAYRLLGQVLQQQGKFGEAEHLLKRAIDLDRKRGHVYLAIAVGRKMTEQDRPFIEQMRSVLGGGQVAISDECSLRYALGKALNDLGEYREALHEYDGANALAARILHQGRPFDRKKLEAAYEHTEALFSKEFFVERRNLGVESDMPIFIIGMMRSGTTLTEQIVSCHPEVAAGGELMFWTKEGLGVLDPTKRTIDQHRLLEVQNAYKTLLEKISGGRKRVTDKRPGNYGVLGLIHLAFPNAKIIHCKRDPVDTALSIYMTHAALVEFGHVREDIVYAYKQYQKLMEFYRRVLPSGAVLDVQYEDLVANQEAVSRQIIDFLGLDWNDACLHHEENTRPVSTPSVWQARQPIYATSVKRWRKYEPWLGAFAELIVEDKSDRSPQPGKHK